MANMDEMLASLCEQLERNFSECDPEERKQMFYLLLTEFISTEKVLSLYMAYSLIAKVEADEKQEREKPLIEIPCIITPNVEEEELPSNVREYLILGLCDQGRIIAPNKPDTKLYRVGKEQPEEADESGMITRNYQVHLAGGGVYHFCEYYSFHTSAFENGWA